MQNLTKRATQLNFLALLIAILPALILGTICLSRAVNIPYWDQVDAPGRIFVMARQHGFSLDLLFSQQNESRLVFPRILFFALAYLTHWDVRYEMLVTFSLACLTSFNLYRLSQITIAGSELKRLFLLLLANLLIFSPIQYENWTWGIQLIVYVPIACITTCLLISYSKLGSRFKAALYTVFCTISTFSYANGLISWIIVFPTVLLITHLPKISPSQAPIKRNHLLLWGIPGFILNIFIYFYNYQKPPRHPSFIEAVLHPLKALQYFSVFLGAPLGFGNLLAAQIVGTILLLLFGIFCFYLILNQHDRLFIAHSLVWVSVGFYAIASGLLATAGRLGFGVEQALAPRYTTFSIYLSISLIFLGTLVTNHLLFSYAVKKYIRLIIRLSIVILITSFLVLSHASFSHGEQQLDNVRLSRLYGKSCALFVNFIHEKSCLETTIHPAPFEVNKPHINAFNQIGFINPPLITSANIKDIAITFDNNSNRNGWFDGVVKLNNQDYLATGWAVFPERNRPADSVILAYEQQDGQAIVFAIASVQLERSDVAKATKNKDYRKSGWMKTFSQNSIPKNATAISAWAFDTETGKAFRLGNIHRLNN